jgi:hypothetical protein
MGADLDGSGFRRGDWDTQKPISISGSLPAKNDTKRKPLLENVFRAGDLYLTIIKVYNYEYNGKK